MRELSHITGFTLKQLVAFGFGLIFGLLLFTLMQTFITSPAKVTDSNFPELPELQDLLVEQATHDDYEDYFQAVAKEKGAPYAFELMKKTSLPFGLDTHLLGHAVGDILYEQEGVDGMAHCTHDFRNACSHTIVIGALLEYGTEIKDQITEACKLAPGGSGAYTMCFHGLGHGVLAFNSYDMETTAEMCQIFGTDEYRNEESSQCFGGAVMEIIGGGGHDRDIWEQKRAEQLAAENPMEICNQPYLTEGQRLFCYVYISPYLLESIGADQGNPRPSDFQQAFTLCEQIDIEDTQIRHECFGGIGKEFIGIVAGRDFRDGISMDESDYKTMQDWCELARPRDGVESCQRSIVGSLYWGGENEIDLPLSFCAVSPTQSRDNCYQALLGNVNRYVKDRDYREAACLLVPEDYTQACRNLLITNLL